MKKHSGFTLIEVMIVVVIVAILAAVAVPSYQDSIRKTRRAEAKEALTTLAARQERYFFSHNSYAVNDTGATPGSAGSAHAKLGVSAESAEGYYTISVVGSGTCTTGGVDHPCYTATATAQGAQTSDTMCKVFSITHTGKKTASKDGGGDSTDECWN